MDGHERECVDTDLLFRAYSAGIFPMGSEDSDELGWYRPTTRCLFPIEGIHVSKSLARTLRQGRFKVTFDQSFGQVVVNCRRPRDNWITEPVVRLYTDAHDEGWAHSCEVWEGDTLVGGTYGLAVGGCFCAESMFHRRTDASKVALHHMVTQCRNLGFVLFDAQIPNPHLMSLGAVTMGQREYMRLLQDVLHVQTPWSRCEESR